MVIFNIKLNHKEFEVFFVNLFACNEDCREGLSVRIDKLILSVRHDSMHFGAKR